MRWQNLAPRFVPPRPRPRPRQVALMSCPVMGVDPTYKGPLERVYRAALALGTANQLTNILRCVGGLWAVSWPAGAAASLLHTHLLPSSLLLSSPSAVPPTCPLPPLRTLARPLALSPRLPPRLPHVLARAGWLVAAPAQSVRGRARPASLCLLLPHAASSCCSVLAGAWVSLPPPASPCLLLLACARSDVGEDAAQRNRIYVPLDELARFNISEDEVRCARCACFACCACMLGTRCACSACLICLPCTCSGCLVCCCCARCALRLRAVPQHGRAGRAVQPACTTLMRACPRRRAWPACPAALLLGAPFHSSRD